MGTIQALVPHTHVRVVATTHPWPGARGGCPSKQDAAADIDLNPSTLSFEDPQIIFFRAATYDHF